MLSREHSAGLVSLNIRGLLVNAKREAQAQHFLSRTPSVSGPRL